MVKVNTEQKSPLWVARFIWLTYPNHGQTLREVRAGTPARAEAGAMWEMLHTGLLSLLSYIIQDHCPVVAPSAVI